MEKILFITAYVPHKASAGEKNTMIMLEDLASRYEVDLIYYKYDDEKEYIPPINNINVICIERNSILKKIFGVACIPIVHPVFSIRFNWPLVFKIRQKIKNKKYKAVILNHSNVFIWGYFINSTIPKILLAHDVIAQRAIRSSSYITRKISIYSERLMFNIKNSHIFSFSQKDCDLIENIYNKKAFVCLDYIDENIINKEISEIKDYFVFFGDWKRKENLDGAKWFFNNVIPHINFKTTIKIIGRNFPIEEEQKINNPFVTIENLGFVDDPYQIIIDSKALISPLFMGAGIKVKVIEALACGTSVIGTEIAFEGLPIDFREQMILANKPEDYLAKMIEIDTNIEKRKKSRHDFIEFYRQESITNYIKNNIL